MLPFALLCCVQLGAMAQKNGEYFFALSGDEASEVYDQMLISYLSRFPMDDNDREFTMLAQGFGRNKLPPGELNAVRKIRQMKVLIISQMDQEIRKGSEGSGFGRYCYYGCHCLPDKHHNEYQTFGRPVDKIDAQCRQMGVCYKCLQHKYGSGKCSPEVTNYAFRIDENTKDIDCTMNRHPCKRDVCECDKQFAVNVAKYEHEWKEEYHIKRAGFDRYSSCRPPKPEPLTASSSGTSGLQFNPTMTGPEGLLTPIFPAGGLFQNGMGIIPVPASGITVISGDAGGGGPGYRPSFQGPETKEIVQDQCCNLQNFPEVFSPGKLHSCCGNNIQLAYNTLTHKCCYGKVIFANEVCF